MVFFFYSITLSETIVNLKIYTYEVIEILKNIFMDYA